MNKMDADKLKIILDKHEAWLRDSGGERANLSGANLSGAYLSVANLSGADLRYAILMYANLCGANLSNADLSDANLRYANLSGAKGILSIGPGGSRGDMLYAIQHETCVMIKGGCFWGTLEEFAAAVDKTHGNNKHGRYYRAVIEMVKAWEKGQRDVPQISKGS